MTQKIVALFALVFVFSFFNAYAGELAPAPVPMPDVSGMVNIAPRWSSFLTTYTCPSGDVISTEGYVKKGNENAEAYDIRRFFLNKEEVHYAATVIEVVDREKEVVKIVAYFDFLGGPSGNRDGFADLVVEITDPRQKEEKLKGEDVCTMARKTVAEFVLAPAPAPEPPAAAVPAPATPSPQPKTE